METLVAQTARTPEMEKVRRFRHLPPTAIPAKSSDLRYAVRALIDPAGSYERFAEALIEFTENPNFFFTSSGRAALALIFLTLKRLSSRSKVILPAYTCPTVAQAVLEAGLRPVFCDVSPHTLDMDRTSLSELLDEQVLAIIPTHLYGLAQDISDLVEFGREREIFIIEDAAQAFGATIHGRMVGTAADFGFFSLGRGKCIPAGHGGIILAGDRFAPGLAETMRETVPGGMKREPASLFRFAAYALATTPFGWWFIARSPLNPAGEGMDARTLPPIKYEGFASTQAGIALSILARKNELEAVRRRNAGQLIAWLSALEFVHFPEIAPTSEPVFLRLPVILDEKPRADRIFHLLSKAGIGVSRSYTRTLPDIFSSHADRMMAFPGADRLADCLLTLPTHPYLQAGDLARIRDVFESIKP